MQEYSIRQQGSYPGMFRRLLFGMEKRGMKSTFTIPDTWDELSYEQLLDVCRIVFNEKYRRKAELLLVHKLSGSGNMFAYMNIEDIETILRPQVSFLFEAPQFKKPVFKSLAGMYYGPGSTLKNMCWKQFALAEDLLEKNKGKKITRHMLVHLAAILYCVTTENATREDWKYALHGDMQEGLEKMYGDLSIEVLQAVYVQYVGLKYYLKFVFEDLNSGQIEIEEEDGTLKKMQVKEQVKDWWSLGIKLANTAFGDYEQLCYTPALDVLKYLNDRKHED